MLMRGLINMNKILKPVMVLTLSLFLVSSSNAQEIKKMHSDKVHFHPWVYTMLVDEVFGPEILKKLK